MMTLVLAIRETFCTLAVPMLGPSSWAPELLNDETTGQTTNLAEKPMDGSSKIACRHGRIYT
jgi:hypothetical protein